MKIGIVGSRSRDSLEDLEATIDKFVEIVKIHNLKQKDIIIVSGGAKKGGDRFAEVIADKSKLQKIIHYPDKSKLPNDPTRRDFAIINFERNTLIARDSDILLACIDPKACNGTIDTVNKYKKMGKDKIYLI